MLIHELMARHAAENPMKTAVSDFRGEISYGELEARSAAAARTLSAFGVRAGSAAAILNTVLSKCVFPSPYRPVKIMPPERPVSRTSSSRERIFFSMAGRMCLPAF